MKKQADYGNGRHAFVSGIKHNLIIEGLVVGVGASLISVAFRFLLNLSEGGLPVFLGHVRQNGWLALLWFAALIAMALLVSRFIRWEPAVAGGGIPNTMGETAGQLDACWWKVLIGKFIGGVLCIFGGLSLGRAGTSVQLGAMAGKGLAQAAKQEPTAKRLFIGCGAGAGLSATFNAPLAGFVFVLEALYRTRSPLAVLAVLTATFTADFISKCVFGLSPVFQLELGLAFPLKNYWLILLLGLFTGLMGALFNLAMLGTQTLYQKFTWLKPRFRLLLPFLCAGALGFLLPEVLGTGHSMLALLTDGKLLFTGMLMLFLVKLLFSAVSSGSGAPGGMFFPLLVLGAFLGGMFGLGASSLTGMEAVYSNHFILLAMAGYFTAIVRAPVTAVVLLSEMSGTFSQLLPLILVTAVAYFVAKGLKSAPIYKSLLERLLNQQAPCKAEPEHTNVPQRD